MTKTAKPHPRDPKGFIAVQTDFNNGTSCSQCALRETGKCGPAPCFERDRQDGESIHYIKKEPRRA